MSNYAGPEVQNNNLVLALDAANPRSYSPNIFPNPLDIGAWAVGNGTCTVSRDPTVTDSPARGVPLKMVVTGLDPYTTTYNAPVWNLAAAKAGQTWTVSVWVKSNITTVGQLFIFGSTDLGTYIESGNNNFNITQSWQRVSYTFPFTNVNITNIQARLDGPDSGVACNVWWDGWQIERSPTMTTFNPRPNIKGKQWWDLLNPSKVAEIGPAGSFNSNTSLGAIHIDRTADGYVKLTTANFNLSAVSNTVITFSRYSNAANIGGRIVTAWDNNWLLGHHDTTAGDFYPNAWLIDAGITTNLTAWKMYTGTVNFVNNVCELYVNDTLLSSGVLVAPVGPSGLYIGGGIYAQYAEGEVALILAYNRVLTSIEIAQVFNAFRSRFSI